MTDQDYLFWIEVIKMLGPALLALAGAWVVAFFHYKSKKDEVEKTVEIKAKEILYNDYTNGLDNNQKTLEKYMAAIGSLNLLDNPEEASIQMIKIIENIAIPYR